MSKLTKIVSLLSALVLLVCLVPTLAAAAVTEETVAVSSVVYSHSNSGFQFQVLPVDSLPYDGEWNLSHYFTEGGLYMADGTLLTTGNFVKKLTQSVYYVGLNDRQHLASDGEIFYLDGVIESDGVRVVFERTYFQYNGGTASWTIVVPPESIEREETVTLRECVSSSATGLYFYVDPADSLPYDGEWNIKYNFEAGGLYKLDGTLLNQITVKLQSTLYYMKLNYTPVDGDILYVDGSIVFDGVRVNYTRAYFQYDADAPAGTTKWAKVQQEDVEEDDSKEKVTMTVKEYISPTNANGFYFGTEEENELVAAGSDSWDVARHAFAKGGVYVKETGALLTSGKTLTKVRATRYYIDLASNGVEVTDGTVIVLDGAVDTDTVRIVFPYTEFVYDEETGVWSIVKQKTEPSLITLEMQDVSNATSADYFYFNGRPYDLLPYDGGWQQKYSFSSGGIYTLDGTLLTGADHLIKLTETLYCVHIKTCGYTAADGDIFVIDGTVEEDGYKVIYPRTAFKFDADTGVWSITEEPKIEATVTMTVRDNISGGNGFYFGSSSPDPLPYSEDWKTRYIFAEGGVYLENGMRLVGPKTLAKLGANSYYLSLADAGHVATDGERITVEGTVKSGRYIVHFERSVFRFDGATGTWKMSTAFEGAQVTLSDKLDTAFAATIPGSVAAKNPSMKFTMNGEVTEVAMPAQSADGLYYFNLPISAKSMADSINAKLMDGNTVIAEKTYSIRMYAEAILNGDYSAEHKAIAKAMLNYGAAAQNYFGYNTGDLANENFAYTNEWNTVDVNALPNITITGPADGYLGTTLLLRSTIGVRLYFNRRVPGSVANDGNYYVEIDGITVNDLDKTYTVTVEDTTYSFSVLALAKKVVLGDYSAKFAALAKAIILYSQTTETMMNTPLILHQIETSYPYHKDAQAYLETNGGNVANFMNGSGDAKQDTVIRWVDNVGGATGYTVLLATKSDFSDAKTFNVGANARSLSVNNLYKNTTYYVKVTANGSGHVATMNFKTTNLGPRVMNVDGVYNVRDLGGYASSLGGTTLQGLIYRGGALYNSEQNVQISEEGIRTMAEEMGIKTEIDIRTVGEAEGITKSFIPGAKLVYYTQSGYKQTLTITTEAVKSTFKLMARPENYPIYFHCTAGADRTGTLGYLINALLGVSEEDLINDYEFTSFSIYGERNSQTTELTFYELEDYLKSIEGDTLAEKAENYLLSIGVTADEIYNVRAIMTGGEPKDLDKFELKTSSDQDNTLKVLAIGNSFSIDSMTHLWRMFYSTGYDSVILGNLAIGGCDLNKHYNNMVNNIADYEYWHNDNNSWQISQGANLLEVLKSEDWDIISIQQVSQDSGRPETFGYLDEIIAFLKENEIGNAKIYWNMTWAYQQDTAHSGFANYGRDQMTMYNAIINAVQSNIATNDQIDGIFTPGTTIQNLRTVLGDELTRDGFHLTEGIGRYAAALTWYCYLSGNSASTVKWVPSSFKDEIAPHLSDIYQAVDASIANPYSVTDIS